MIKLPEQLEPYRTRKVWMNYVLYKEDGRLKKPPINPYTLSNGSSTNPEGLADFDYCKTILGKVARVNLPGGMRDFPVAGVGLSLEAAGLVGIDLDHVILRKADGSIASVKAEARKIWQAVDSYTEISVSGTGIHILAVAKNPNKELNKNGKPKGIKIKNSDGTDYELYDNGRYFTFTGRALIGCKGICERQEQIDALYREIFSAEYQPVAEATATGRYEHGSRVEITLSDQAILEKAFRSRSGVRIQRLYQGSTLDYSGDHSAADCALIADLGYWTNYDRERTDRLFRFSGLYRAKWERKDYREATFKRAWRGKIPYCKYS